MSKRRWSKFWWQDHERDAALRLCSLAAQGLWVRLLCLMHEAEPYGYLCLNGHPAQPRQLALMVGVPERQLTRLMAELGKASVFSTTPEGCIFSRRLVRDRLVSDQGAAWGRTGGNPRLQTQPDPTPTPPPHTGPAGLTPPHKHQEAEAETEAEITLTPFTPTQDARTQLFKQGLVFLQTATGRPERSSRALLGKWLKMLHDDAQTLNTVLADCAIFRPAEPVSWLEATVRKRVAEQQEASTAPIPGAATGAFVFNGAGMPTGLPESTAPNTPTGAPAANATGLLAGTAGGTTAGTPNSFASHAGAGHSTGHSAHQTGGTRSAAQSAFAAAWHNVPDLEGI